MDVIGIVLWVLALVWAVVQGLVIRQKAGSEQATEHVWEVHALLLAVSVAVIPVLSLSPLHLLWMVPTSFFLGLASVLFPLNLLWIPASLYGTLWRVGVSNPALALYRSGDYLKAITAFEEAIQRKADSAENHFYLALAYDKTGDHRKAILSFQECLRLKPDHPEAHCNLAFTFKDSGDVQSALESFSQAVRLRPAYPKAIANLGMIYVDLGDLVSANKQCTALEALDANQAMELRAAITAAEGRATEPPTLLQS